MHCLPCLWLPVCVHCLLPHGQVDLEWTGPPQQTCLSDSKGSLWMGRGMQAGAQAVEVEAVCCLSPLTGLSLPLNSTRMHRAALRRPSPKAVAESRSFVSVCCRGFRCPACISHMHMQPHQAVKQAQRCPGRTNKDQTFQNDNQGFVTIMLCMLY